jgi:SAM-dependent methyltransferase
VTRGYGLLEGFLAGLRSRQADRLIPEGRRQGRLLDIGCGSHPLFLLGTRFEHKFGIDQVDPALNSHPAELKITRKDLGADPTLPFEAGFFDVVTMLAVYEHLESSSLAVLLGEVRRVLKPGGRFVITTPAPWAEWVLVIMARSRLVSRVELEEHKDTYSPDEIVGSLVDAGFEREKIAFGLFELRLNIWVTAER